MPRSQWVSTHGGYVGLVDERRGYHRASLTKPVMICLRAPDVDAWYRYLKGKGVQMLSGPYDSQEPKIRLFMLHDPEGYVIEI